MGKRTFYELSDAADQDISKIFDYTEEEFGFDQAVAYVSELEDLFNLLIENPEIGRSRNEIRTNLRSLKKLSHIVFYRNLKDRIRIVRVLHGSKDIQDFLE